jgi:5-methyltetrahydropteroyltriglutamate--homocysteine methyltransferase
MNAVTRVRPRAETVGSLLQAERLVQAREKWSRQLLSNAELQAIEDEEVLRVIREQERLCLDVITDGEMRRRSWADTPRYLDGLELRADAPRSYPNSARAVGRDGAYRGGKQVPTVVSKIAPKAGPGLGGEFAFLNRSAAARAKYTMAAPSYHRRYWSDEVSGTESPYTCCEDFLVDVRDWQRGVVSRLAASGCTYVQLDAPNYGSLCDPETRAFHQAHGHDLPSQIAFDAALDSSVFEGAEVTSALHVCRGNGPGAKWHSAGGYGVLAQDLFGNLDMDVVLLEYDTDRAGDFSALRSIKAESTAVLGLLSTKTGSLEDYGAVERRVSEACAVKPLETLALSTQCGFSSAANAPMTEEEQWQKLALVCAVARAIWSD